MRQRSVPIIIEFDQPLCTGDPEEERRSEHEQANAQIARKQRDEEPVAKVGEQLAFAPPGSAGVAGPEEGQERKGGPKPPAMTGDEKKVP